MLRVKIVHGIKQKNCSCGSWLDHWEKFSRQERDYCAVKGCIKTELTGAHVQLAGSDDSAMYIIPLCKEHSAAKGELEISKVYKLVPADVKLTCEKE